MSDFETRLRDTLARFRAMRGDVVTFASKHRRTTWGAKMLSIVEALDRIAPPESFDPGPDVGPGVAASLEAILSLVDRMLDDLARRLRESKELVGERAERN